MPQASPKATDVSIGVCYYPEHWPEAVWPEDARRMREAGISRVRIGEFAWSRLEPSPGEYDFDWLARPSVSRGEAALGRSRRARTARCGGPCESRARLFLRGLVVPPGAAAGAQLLLYRAGLRHVPGAQAARSRYRHCRAGGGTFRIRPRALALHAACTGAACRRTGALRGHRSRRAACRQPHGLASHSGQSRAGARLPVSSGFA